MRQAIETKYLGPTNYRGPRVKAKCDAGSLTLPWDHSLDVGDNHMTVAGRLAIRLGWLGSEAPGVKMVGGSLPQSHAGYAFVLVAS
jgi:hypothetical protein